jgi:hypothetical protein
MNENENFITRWSRRKREAAEENQARPTDSVPPSPEGTEGAPGGMKHSLPGDLPPPDALRASTSIPQQETKQEPEPAFDLSRLPPIESITAETDIRAFLAPGVPTEISRAALRRAWAADPKIRDFVGLSENAWDFNDPTAVPGFGALEMTDEVGQHGVESSEEIAAKAGELPRPATSAAGTSPAQSAAVAHAGIAEAPPSDVRAAAQHISVEDEEEASRLISHRPQHGRALPQ